MAFIQIIEYTTTRGSELDPLFEAWLEKTGGKRSATRSLHTSDRDSADTYIEIVEFPSYEAATANSNLPETAEFARQLAALCDAPPSFRNLDVLREDRM